MHPSPCNPARGAADDLERIRSRAPLVLSLTNSVVQPLTANLLLAVGAVAAMLNDPQEAAEMIHGGAQALLINLGTLTRSQGKAMLAAVQAANEAGIPWVLDPVAVGALSLRTHLAMILKEQTPKIIRGNASEIRALAGHPARTRGPESTCSSAEALEAAALLARETGAVVLVTGRIDYATDGIRTFSIENGHALMSRMTGTGCSMGALAAACATVSPTPLQAAVSTAVLMGLAGEWAFSQSSRPGTFAAALLDAMDAIDRGYVLKHAHAAAL
ncbi:MAG: hydroxyethylthiazole kinase [Akkermansiaceae bacterium]|nr:hydroxyethylthiazole kinase [Akkermansiaceae bacterium]